MKMPDTTKAASSTHRTGQIVPATVPKVNRLTLARTTGHAASTGDVATTATAATAATDWASTGYTDNVDNVDNFSGLALAACTPMQARGTIATDAQKHHGFGDPVINRRSSRAQCGQRLFYVHVLHMARTATRFGGPCGDTREGVPVPIAGSPTPHGLPPSFGDGEGRFYTCSIGAIMANTLTPKGRIAPTSKATPAISPTEAQAHASLAGFYLRKGNIAQARRKLRQALQALNALEVAHA